MPETTLQSPNLNKFDRSDVDEFREPTSLLIHEVIRKQGAHELDRPRTGVFWSGISAGLIMGLSVLGYAAVESHLPDADWTILISSFGFTLGYLITILGRQGSFGESSLACILPVLTEKTKNSCAKLLSFWSVVLVANLIGALAIAAIFAFTNILSVESRLEITKDAHDVMATAGWTIFFKAILAGWIIALALWTAVAARAGRVAIVVLLIYSTKLFALDHLLTGSIGVLTGVFLGTETFTGYLIGFLVPVVLGNLIGGVGLVGVLNHAQVAIELKNEHEPNHA